MRQEIEFTHDERIIMERLATAAKSVDELILETEFDIPKLSEILFHLQVKNAITQQENRYAMC
jgi:predicted Rossmann fold nucleotide-binding protein DprA/Smf involved in DNA uptake